MISFCFHFIHHSVFRFAVFFLFLRALLFFFFPSHGAAGGGGESAKKGKRNGSKSLFTEEVVQLALPSHSSSFPSPSPSLSPRCSNSLLVRLAVNHTPSALPPTLCTSSQSKCAGLTIEGRGKGVPLPPSAAAAAAAAEAAGAATRGPGTTRTLRSALAGPSSPPLGSHPSAPTTS